MITLPPDFACMMYVGGLILCLMVLWWKWNTRLKKKDILKIKTKRLTCELCKSEYLDESFTSFHRCPVCGCLNLSEETSKNKGS